MTDPEKTLSGRVEKYLRTLLATIGERLGARLERQIADHQARLGLGVAHWAYNPFPSIVDDGMGEAATQAPIDAWAIHPRTFYPMPSKSQRQFEYVVHIEKRSIIDVLQVVQTLNDGGWAAKQLQERLGNVHQSQWYNRDYEFCDYWGYHFIEGKWQVVNAIMFSDILIRPMQVLPGYKRLPWAIAPAQDTGHEDLEKRWLPITYHAKSHVRHAEKTQGMMTTILEKVANFPFVIELDGTYSEPPEIQAGKDAFIFLKPGQKFTPPPMAGIPRDLYPQLELFDRRIQKTTFPDGMHGLAGPASGMNSGYGYEQQQEGGTNKVVEPAELLQECMQTFFRGVCSLIGTHAPMQPLIMNQVTQQPELMGKDLLGWTLEVRWRVELPGDKLRKIAMATQATGSGLVSQYTAREVYLDLEDPVDEEELLLKERVMSSHPDIAQAKAFDILFERGALPNFDVAAKAELQMKIQRAVAYAQAAGTPPQIVQQMVQGIIQQEHGRLLAQYMSPMIGGVGPQQDAPQRGPDPSQQAERNTNAPQMGNQGNERMGGPPQGNPRDPTAPLRQMSDAMRAGR